MIEFVFYKVIYMSVSGGIVGVALLLASLLTKKYFSAKWHFYIWLVPLLLMLIPFSWQSKTAIDIVPVQTEKSPAAVEYVSNNASEAITNVDTVQVTVPQQNVASKFDLKSIKSYIPMMWFIAFLIMLFHRAIARILFAKRLRRIVERPVENYIAVFESVKRNLNIKNEVELKCFTGNGSPFVCGIIKPTVYIPDIDISDSELQTILTHELSHVKRYDLIYKAFADFVATIHFFNPIIYLIQMQMGKYCELSCDEQIVGKMNADERRMYSRIILNLMSGRSLNLNNSVALSDNMKNTKNRLEVILKDKKRSKMILMISTVLICVITVSGIAFAINVNNLNKTKLPINTSKRNSLETETSAYNTNNTDLNAFISRQSKVFPPAIAYADEEKAVFYNEAGVLVYSLKEHKILRFIDFRSIHLDTDPQNNSIYFDVNNDGSQALIHHQSIKIEDGKLIRTDTPVWYQYDVNTGAIEETNLKKFESPFTNLMYHAFDGKSNIFTGSDHVGIYTTDTDGTIGPYGARIDDNTIVYARYPYLCKSDEEDKLRIENTEVVIYNIKAGTLEKYKLFEGYNLSDTSDTLY